MIDSDKTKVRRNNIENFLINIWNERIFVLSLHSQLRKNGLRHLTIHRGVEQLAARRAHNPEVGGSSPPPATIEDKSLDLPSFFDLIDL